MASFGPIAWFLGVWATTRHFSYPFELLEVFWVIKIGHWCLRLNHASVSNHPSELMDLIHGLSPIHACKSIKFATLWLKALFWAWIKVLYIKAEWVKNLEWEWVDCQYVGRTLEYVARTGSLPRLRMVISLRWAYESCTSLVHSPWA